MNQNETSRIIRDEMIDQVKEPVKMFRSLLIDINLDGLEEEEQAKIKVVLRLASRIASDLEKLQSFPNMSVMDKSISDRIDHNLEVIQNTGRQLAEFVSLSKVEIDKIKTEINKMGERHGTGF